MEAARVFPRLVRPAQLLAALEEVVGTGMEPDGLCGDRGEHRAHLHDSATLGRFWCTADQSQREPYRSEQRRCRMHSAR